MKNRTMIILVMTIAVCMIVETVEGQLSNPIMHLKKENPNELIVSYFEADNCTWDFASVIDMEMVKSRIKRKTALEFNTLLLDINLSCLETKLGTVAFSIEMAFGEYIITEPGDDLGMMFRGYDPFTYGLLGAVGKDNAEYFIRNAIRDRLEIALTDYLKANFDL